MKKFAIMLSLFCTLLYSQEYLNVEFTGSQFKNSPLENIQQITFSPDGSQIIFEMVGGGTGTEPLESIVQMTFGTSGLGDQSLPVELTGFHAIKSGDAVTLFWCTASEVANSGFDVERLHSDITNWEKITFVQGHGNSSEPIDYTYIDDNVKGLQNLKYRLKQQDYDGTFEYSPVVVVTVDEIKTPITYQLNNNYPNPFNPATTISYQIPEEGLTNITVYDMRGREVAQLVNKQQIAGHYNVSFDASELGSGVYFCKMISGNYTKTIKMLLVK